MKPAAALAAVFAAGALASRLLAGHTPAHFSIDRAQPVPVATAWGGFGMLTFLLLALTIGCAFLPYVLLLRRPPPLRITLATVVAVLVAGAWFTPLFSSDIYAYAAYGEMARTGLNPYLHHVLPASDRIFTAAAWQWPQLPACVYGEGFVAIARGISTLFAGAPVWVQLSAFRILAMAALPVCLALCGAIAKDERQRRFSGVFLTCNPIVIWSAIEGHNDALMIAAVLAAIAIARRFPFASIVTAASAVAI
ncbi:MAG: hypothetical protein ABI282_04940, partial [Candidatus Baltobacteraceae bacterium]